jgi:hypothetical protein
MPWAQSSMSEFGFLAGSGFNALSFYALAFWPITLAALAGDVFLGLKLRHRATGGLVMGLAVTGVFMLASNIFAVSQ